MENLFYVLATVVALEHLYIMCLEMFNGESQRVERVFNINRKLLVDPTIQMMLKNQGLYNGFLGVGILFGLYVASDLTTAIYLIICVIIAGIYAGITVERKILVVQGMPALLTIIVYLFI